MAESVQQKCSNCKKMGMIRCDGCTQRFCSTHFSEHRHQLDISFERVCNNRDTLCEQIKNPRPTSVSNHPQITSLLDEITQWERETVKLVKQTAERTRQQINELITSNSKAAETELNTLSTELRRRKEEDDYFEQDIERLSKKLERIQLDLNVEPPHTQLTMTPVDWTKILRVTTEILQYNIHRAQEQLFVGGTLLTFEHQIQLNKFYGNQNQKWQLIYKATRDGFDPNSCHHCCDKQGPTLTIIQSTERYLFGGYTSASWDINGDGHAVDKSAFLFTLTNPHNISPTRYSINPEGENAVWSAFSIGPAFGYFDICLYLGMDTNSQSFTQFPKNYIDSTGKGNLTFTGSSHFLLTDVEMYRLISQ